MLAGVPDLGRELGKNEALLVTAKNKKSYLVYTTPSSANNPTSSAVRAEVDLTDSKVLSALKLSGLRPRNISSGLLNAIPEVKELSVPNISGAGDTSNVNIQNFDIGTVFSIQRPGEEESFYVVLRDGIQEIKQSTASLLRFANSIGGEQPRRVTEDSVTNVRKLTEFDESTFPDVVPDVLQPDSNSNSATACLGWTVVGPEGNRQPKPDCILA